MNKKVVVVSAFLCPFNLIYMRMLIIMDQKNYKVYMHINKTNNKVYIGITSKSVEERWGRNGYHYKRNRHFWGAIQK